MRSIRVLLPALVVGVLAACGQTAGPAGRGTSTPSAGATDGGSFHTEVAVGDVRLSAGRALTEDGSLVVDYALRNVGAAALLAHDRVPPTLGSATLPEELDPIKVWIFMTDNQVRLSKQAFDPAPGVRFIAEPVMGARRLEPGQTLTGRARTGLPLRLEIPGPEFDAPRTPIDAGAIRFEFCVQVTARVEGRPSGVAMDVLEVPARAPRDGELICSQPLDLPS